MVSLSSPLVIPWMTKLMGYCWEQTTILPKPFHLSELNARVKALIRRKYNQGSAVLEVGSLQSLIF